MEYVLKCSLPFTYAFESKVRIKVSFTNMKRTEQLCCSIDIN